MDNGTVVQIVAGIIFVILLVILVQRRRNRVR
jgi:LPXTG-motif cell wall-anchored protein